MVNRFYSEIILTPIEEVKLNDNDLAALFYLYLNVVYSLRIIEINDILYFNLFSGVIDTDSLNFRIITAISFILEIGLIYHLSKEKNNTKKN